MYEAGAWKMIARVMSHEIINVTTPIVSISRSLLGRDDVKGTPLEAGIAAISSSSQRMCDLIVSYRKISNIEKPQLEDIPLRPIIESVFMLYPGLVIETQALPDVTVRADASMLKHVFINIVNNAVEAGAKRLFVSLDSARHSSRSMVIYVGNDGQPIADEDRQSLFFPSFTTKPSGNGIGLALSKRMMVIQGGKLELADKHPAGCQVGFLLTIPLS